MYENSSSFFSLSSFKEATVLKKAADRAAAGITPCSLQASKIEVVAVCFQTQGKFPFSSLKIECSCTYKRNQIMSLLKTKMFSDILSNLNNCFYLCIYDQIMPCEDINLAY